MYDENTVIKIALLAEFLIFKILICTVWVQTRNLVVAIKIYLIRSK